MYRLALLPGDGIGPEVTREAVRVLEAAANRFGFVVETHEHPVGGAALAAGLDVLPAATLEACRNSDAVLLGAVGGPTWDHVSPEQRPERALLGLRKELGVFVNLRPVVVSDSVESASPLRPELVTGVDLVVVRELTGGIYFGASFENPTCDDGRVDQAGNVMEYTRAEVERVAREAFKLARRRRRKVTSVDKANVLGVSRLWRDVVSSVHAAEFADVELQHLYVDNAAMQLVRNPRQFDVILTGNMFGDILSDLAGTLPGSLGMLPSASLGGTTGLFEPVHGSAPDIVGTGKANPLAAILSVVMMLDSLHESDASAAVQIAVAASLAAGLRTADMAKPGAHLVTTRQMGAAVARQVAGDSLPDDQVLLAEQLYSHL
ncbi:MAG: 3-isopropylmalate dehydrogenase [Rhodothermales bacterium]|nr:3-isopropylmalate dehydrogenase [Rhodothermales bacterium]